MRAHGPPDRRSPRFRSRSRRRFPVAGRSASPQMRTAKPYTHTPPACSARWTHHAPACLRPPVHHTPCGFRTRSYVAPSPTPVFMECGRLSCSMVDHQDEPPTDVELVAAALRNPGSDAAVEELYRRRREPVLSYAYTCRRDPRSTEDPTSEAFARAVRDARSGCGPTVARRPYLLTVVRRTATTAPAVSASTITAASLLRRRTALLSRRRPGTRIGRAQVHLRQHVGVTH